MKPPKVITISEATALAPSKLADQFAIRHRARTKAFIEQGKIVYALENKKLKTDQSVQGLLTSRGVPAGSIGNARKASAIITALVATEHLPEAVYDDKLTWRIVRMANKVLGFDKGCREILPPKKVAEIIATPKASSAEIADELECLAEHGVTRTERDIQLKAKEKEEKAAEKLRKENEAELEKLRKETEAEADAEIEADSKPPIEITSEDIPEPDLDEDDAEDEVPDAEDDADAEETHPEAETTNFPLEKAPPTPKPTPQPEKPTAEAILERLLDIHHQVSDLDADGMKQVLNAVNELQQGIIECLNEVSVEQAA